MSKTIFYSWQSDLPNSYNRSFIQQCISNAIEIIQSADISLEIAIDRDTLDVSGSPDIVATIFEKIEKSNIFIADISIVNSSFEKRKSPNPNVLVELGYAAKAIGWRNIICIFNTEYGVVTDLPFDLRFRRILQYSITNPKNKAKDRQRISNTVLEAITSILDGESQKEEIKNYIKQQIDTEILTICNHLFKIFYGYEKAYTLPEIHKLISLSYDNIQMELFEKKYLGFTVLKIWEHYKRKIEAIMNQPFVVQNAEMPLVHAIIKVIKCLEMMTVISNRDDLFENLVQEDSTFEAISGTRMNPENPKDSFILLKKTDISSKGIVIDFGTFKKYNNHKLLHYQSIGAENFTKWVNGVFNLLKSIEIYVEITGSELILNPMNFRVHSIPK